MTSSEAPSQVGPLPVEDAETINELVMPGVQQALDPTRSSPGSGAGNLARGVSRGSEGGAIEGLRSADSSTRSIVESSASSLRSLTAVLEEGAASAENLLPASRSSGHPEPGARVPAGPHPSSSSASEASAADLEGRPHPANGSSGHAAANGNGRPARSNGDGGRRQDSSSSSSSSSSGDEAAKSKRREKREEKRFAVLLENIRSIVRREDNEELSKLRRECEELRTHLADEQKKREKAEQKYMVERVVAQEGERARLEAKADKAECERLRNELSSLRVDHARIQAELQAAQQRIQELSAMRPMELREQLKAMQDDANELRTEVTRLGETLEMERHQGSILEADRISLATKAEREAESKQRAEAALAELRAKCAGLEEQLAQVGQRAEAECKALREQLEAAGKPADGVVASVSVELKNTRNMLNNAKEAHQAAEQERQRVDKIARALIAEKGAWESERRALHAGLAELRASAGVEKHRELASRLIQAEAAVENLKGELEGYRHAYGPLSAEAVSPRTRAATTAAGVRSVGGHVGAVDERAVEELLESLRRDGAITPHTTPARPADKVAAEKAAAEKAAAERAMPPPPPQSPPPPPQIADGPSSAPASAPAPAGAGLGPRRSMTREEADAFNETLARIDKSKLLVDYKNLLRANAELKRELALARATAARLESDLARAGGPLPAPEGDVSAEADPEKLRGVVASLQAAVRAERAGREAAETERDRAGEARRAMEGELRSVSNALQQAEARRAQVEKEAVAAAGSLAEERAKLRKELDIYERRITELRKTFMRLEALFDEDYGASFLSSRRRDHSAKDRETISLLRGSIRGYQDLLESNSVVKNGLIEQLERDLEAQPTASPPQAPNSARSIRRVPPDGPGSLPGTPAREGSFTARSSNLRRAISFQSERDPPPPGIINSLRAFVSSKVIF